MNRRVLTLPAVGVLVSFFAPGWMGGVDVRSRIDSGSDAVAPARAFPASDHGLAWTHVESRRQDDFVAMVKLRPGYTFWRTIFTIPDGSVAFGSALDGRALAVFTAHGDWTRKGKWSEPSLAAILDGKELPASVDDRREYVAELLSPAVGPVLHNVTRGRFVSPGAERYGSFFKDWGAIYERFGVPAEIGLAQALVESGFQGTRRSEAGAVGLCQWLERNWKHLDSIDPARIEAHNQTTQAAYCAAYLSVLATKYGSFIPALSEHHAGGTNVGRILVNGQRLGGRHPRDRYFLGANFARDLRAIGHERYGDVYQSYGPRSYRYAEMIFGNAHTVGAILTATPQVRIHGMRTARSVPLSEITRRTGLSADEIKRFNPALVKSVPAGATLYLPVFDAAFGRDVSFWHRPAGDAYAAVLYDFVRLDASPEEWDAPSFERDLTDFARRFRATGTEEGTVMATMLTYVQADTRGRRGILSAFKTSDEIRSLFDRALLEREGTEALRTE